MYQEYSEHFDQPDKNVLLALYPLLRGVLTEGDVVEFDRDTKITCISTEAGALRIIDGRGI